MNWQTLDKVTIFNGKDEHGNRYLSQFLKDYQQIFNPDLINAGCERCLEDYYHKMQKHLSTMKKVEEKTGYVLKEKYQGIPLEFGSRTQVYNANLTDAIAEKLLKNHPRGKELFDKIPEGTNVSKTEEGTQDLIKLTRTELDAIAEKLGINPNDYSNKGEVAAAIEDVQKATVQFQTETGADAPEELTEEGTQE